MTLGAPPEQNSVPACDWSKPGILWNLIGWLNASDPHASTLSFHGGSGARTLCPRRWLREELAKEEGELEELIKLIKQQRNVLKSALCTERELRQQLLVRVRWL